MSRIPPLIRIRGLRGKSFPTGFLVGRSSKGRGDLELMDVNKLRGFGLATRAQVQRRTSSAGFGFFAQGLLADGEVLGAAVFPFDLRFTDSNANTAVSAQVAATASSVFKLTAQDASYIPVDVGTITFAAASTVGVVAWAGGEYILLAGRSITLSCPNPADATLASVSGTIAGVK